MNYQETVSFLKNNDKLVEAQRLQERTNYDMEMMRELGYCQGYCSRSAADVSALT